MLAHADVGDEDRRETAGGGILLASPPCAGPPSASPNIEIARIGALIDYSKLSTPSTPPSSFLAVEPTLRFAASDPQLRGIADVDAEAMAFQTTTRSACL